MNEQERGKMQKRDDQLILDYAETFFGYGSYDSKYWFVGMEQGGGNRFETVNLELETWRNRKGPDSVEPGWCLHGTRIVPWLATDRTARPPQCRPRLNLSATSTSDSFTGLRRPMGRTSLCPAGGRKREADPPL